MQITSGVGRGIDNHSITMEVLNIVCRSSWGVKAVTLIYGDLCILLQMHDTNAVAKSLALIKGLPGTGVDVRALYTVRFEAVHNLINEMLETTRCAQIEEIPSVYVPDDEHPDCKVARKLFPKGVYAVIRSGVAAATQISTSTRKRVVE